MGIRIQARIKKPLAEGAGKISVDMDIDQPGRHDQPGHIHDVGGVFHGDIRFHRCNFSIRNAHLAQSIHSIDRVDHPPAF